MTMTRGNLPPTNGANVNGGNGVAARLAQRLSEVGLGTLLDICDDERASASARAMAVRTLLEGVDGRPGQARPLVIADYAAMSDEDRLAHFRALFSYYENSQPDFLKQLLEDAYVSAHNHYRHHHRTM